MNFIAPQRVQAGFEVPQNEARTHSSIQAGMGTGMASSSRQHMMRRIGVFELIDGEFHGRIAALNFKCEAVIKENPYRRGMADAEYAVLLKDAEVFSPELGYAWEKKTVASSVPYFMVHLDDPSFPRTIVAVLIKGHQNYYHLFWDRVTIAEEDIEAQYVTEELKPYVSVLRPLINPPSDYLVSIYPSLAEVWDPD